MAKGCRESLSLKAVSHITIFQSAIGPRQSLRVTFSLSYIFIESYSYLFCHSLSENWGQGSRNLSSTWVCHSVSKILPFPTFSEETKLLMYGKTRHIATALGHSQSRQCTCTIMYVSSLVEKFTQTLYQQYAGFLQYLSFLVHQSVMKMNWTLMHDL